MSEKVVRIRVLAVADPSLKTAFAPLEDAARRARDRAAKVTSAPIRNQGAYRTAYQLEERAFEQTEARKRAIAERNARYIERVKYASLLREQRESEQVERATERRQEKIRRDFGTRFGRSVMGLGRGVVGAAGDLARGAGIDASPATLMQRYITAERAAIGVTVAGKTAKGQRATQADVEATQAAIGSAADSTKRDRTEVGNALAAFVGKASDLDLGLQVIKDLGKIANATDSDLVDLATSAGFLATTMGDVPDKANQVTRAIRMLAKQGTMGTVEIKDLATMMPRLAAGANAYAGDYERNLGNLGAVAQLAVKGQRVGPAEATNTAQSIARDLAKARTAKKFEKAGIQLFADQAGKNVNFKDAVGKDGQLTANTKFRNVEDLLVDVLNYTKGDQLKIAHLMPNQVSNAAVKSLTPAFLEGEKREKGGGEKAVRKIFADFRATMTGEDVEAGSSLYENSVGGRAQGVQNKLEGLFGQGIGGLLKNPGDFVKGLGTALTNPTALAAMIGGSALGAGGSDAMAIAALTVTTMTVGSMLIDDMRKKSDAEESKAITDRIDVKNKAGEAIASSDPAVVAARLEELRTKKAEQEALAKSATQQSVLSGAAGVLGGLPGLIYGTATAPGAATAENAGEGARETAAEIARLEQHLAALNQKTNGEVRIMNLSELASLINSVGGGPNVDPNGRDAPRPGARF